MTTCCSRTVWPRRGRRRINRWLRLLPASGAPAPSSWENYARAVKEWTEFLAEHGIGLFDTRDRLKAGLSRYAEHRAAGPVTARFAATTWAQHMSILSLFYRWAMGEGFAEAEPFTYRSARAVFAGTGREVRVNLAGPASPQSRPNRQPSPRRLPHDHHHGHIESHTRTICLVENTHPSDARRSP
jgi:hypothetical protein